MDHILVHIADEPRLVNGSSRGMNMVLGELSLNLKGRVESWTVRVISADQLLDLVAEILDQGFVFLVVEQVHLGSHFGELDIIVLDAGIHHGLLLAVELSSLLRWYQ